MSYWSPLQEWYPLFVTEQVPISTINTILTQATSEQSIHNGFEPTLARGEPLFKNRWVLIEKRNQTQFQTPATSVPDSFSSEFIGASVEDLVTFVEINFAEATERNPEATIPEGVIPEGGIADAPIGILDAQSAEDHSILCLSTDFISQAEEADLRLVWGGATRQDEALVRVAEAPRFGDTTDEDIAILAQHMDWLQQWQATSPILSHQLGSPAVDPPQESHSTESADSITNIGEEERNRVKQWHKETADGNGNDLYIWIGLRFPANNSMSSICGLFQTGALWDLFEHKKYYNERGVKKAMFIGAPCE